MSAVLHCRCKWRAGMITEAEAKTKWCPLARLFVQSEIKTGGSITQIVTASANAGLPTGNDGDDIRPHCIGSACMAWREVKERTSTGCENDARPPGPDWELDGNEIRGPAGSPYVMRNWKRT